MILLYIAFIGAILLSLYAQIKVSSTFNRYSRFYTRAGRTAAETTAMILSKNNMQSVGISRIGGSLTDHFDPRSNTVALSDSVYSSASAAAIGVAAHEAGHAIQHNRGYFPLVLRRMLVPFVSFASRASFLFILIGVLIDAVAYSSGIGYYVLMLGIALFSLTSIFQLITLPCEFNASGRAISAMRESGWYTDEEIAAARKVLTAAALTYVAAMLVSVLQLVRLVLVFGGRRRR